MISEVTNEGFSEFSNSVVTYTSIFVMRNQLVCGAKVILTSYRERSPRKSFGAF